MSLHSFSAACWAVSSPCPLVSVGNRAHSEQGLPQRSTFSFDLDQWIALCSRMLFPCWSFVLWLTDSNCFLLRRKWNRFYSWKLPVAEIWNLKIEVAIPFISKRSDVRTGVWANQKALLLIDFFFKFFFVGFFFFLFFLVKQKITHNTKHFFFLPFKTKLWKREGFMRKYRGHSEKREI